MNELALFAGAGGGILGGHLLGWRTVCAVEIDAYARDVLVARQNDGCLAPFPIWDDICTFDGRPWRGLVDVVSGGFPCQDISAAGTGVGITGERSGLWREMARIVGEIRPAHVYVENSPMLVGRGLGLVLGDLAEMGYDARWGIVGAHHARAPHERDRIWIMADCKGCRLEGCFQAIRVHGTPCAVRGSQSSGSSHGKFTVLADSSGGRCGGEGGREVQLARGTEAFGSSEDVPDSLRTERESRSGRWGVWEGDSAMADAESKRLEGHERDPGKSEVAEPWNDGASMGNLDRLSRRAGTGGSDGEEVGNASWWAAEPDVGRVAHGVAARVDRLRCIGNGQVSGVVPIAWRQLLSQMNRELTQPDIV